MRRSSGGGERGTHQGAGYEHRVTAFAAVHILAGGSASTLWDLPSDATTESVNCTTMYPLDDILVKAHGGNRVFGQAKHRVSLSASPDSDLGDTVGQCVRQYLLSRDQRDPELDEDRDRLALITPSSSSRSVVGALTAVLGALRVLTPDEPLDHAPKNQKEKAALETVSNHVVHWFTKLSGSMPTTEDITKILKFIRVYTADVDAGESDEKRAIDLLRSEILMDPVQDHLAWNTLIGWAARSAGSSTGGDRAELQRVLRDASVVLWSPREYRDDIDRLREYTARALERAAAFSAIEVGTTSIHVERHIAQVIRDAALTGPLLVTGEPGAGKSGALYSVGRDLLNGGHDVVFLDASDFAVDTRSVSGADMLPDRPIPEVLGHWEGDRPAVLIIDALDAVRGGDGEQLLRRIMGDVVRAGGRWCVLASVRIYDARHSLYLPSLFPGDAIAPCDPNLSRVRHTHVPLLDDDELAQIRSQSVEIDRLVLSSEPGLRALLRTPFNLRLAGDLLGNGVSVDDLTPIHTQVELLDGYWKHRVLQGDVHADNRETVLRRVVQAMIADRALQAIRSVATANDTSAGEHLHELLTSNVLTEWQFTPPAAPHRQRLAFAHHMLFDYAAARLIFGAGDIIMIDQLRAVPDLAVFLRPSLVLHLHDLWNATSDHHPYWEAVADLVTGEGLSGVARIVGPSMLPSLLTSADDANQLLDWHEGEQPVLRDTAEQILRYVVGAVLAANESDMSPLVDDRGVPWWTIMERASRRMTVTVVGPLTELLRSVREHTPNVAPSVLDLVGTVSRRVLDFARDHPSLNQAIVTMALRLVCRTYGSNPEASHEILRRCVEGNAFDSRGIVELYAMSSEIDHIFSSDPALASDIYLAVFSHRVTSRAPTNLSQSAIMPLTSTQTQDYSMVKFQLTEAFPRFLAAAPAQATEALVAIVDRYIEEHYPSVLDRPVVGTFGFRGRAIPLCPDHSEAWDWRSSAFDGEDDGPNG